MADLQWVTVNGKHIPVDEDNKKRQIDFNKKEADKRNNSGSGKKLSLSKLDKLNNRKTKKGKEA